MSGNIKRLGLERFEVAPAREGTLWINFPSLWLTAYGLLDF